MAREFGAVVEGHSLAELFGQACEQADELASDRIGGFVGRPGGKEDSGLALVHGQHRLTVFGEQHEVGFPMAGGVAVGGRGGPFGYGNPAFDEACRAAAAVAPQAPFALAAGQIVAPAVVLGAGDLGVDEAVDALVADQLAAGLAGQPAGDLLGGPTSGKAFQNGAAQVGLAFEARARPQRRAFACSWA